MDKKEYYVLSMWLREKQIDSISATEFQLANNAG